MTVNSINSQQTSSLWQGAGIGGLIGMFIGQPILGALGGLAYKLFSTEGLAASAGKILGDVTGSDDPVAAFGKWFGGGSAASENANTGATAGGAEPKAAPQQKSGGLPGWVKALGIGVAGLTALNFVQDTMGMGFGGMGFGGMGFGGMGGLGMGFLGQPYYGGFGFGYPYF